MCVYVGEGSGLSFAMPNPFVLTNKICLNQAKETCMLLTNQFCEASSKLYNHILSK